MTFIFVWGVALCKNYCNYEKAIFSRQIKLYESCVLQGCADCISLVFSGQVQTVLVLCSRGRYRLYRSYVLQAGTDCIGPVFFRQVQTVSVLCVLQTGTGCISHECTPDRYRLYQSCVLQAGTDYQSCVLQAGTDCQVLCSYRGAS